MIYELKEIFCPEMHYKASISNLLSTQYVRFHTSSFIDHLKQNILSFFWHYFKYKGHFQLLKINWYQEPKVNKLIKKEKMVLIMAHSLQAKRQSWQFILKK